jgi:enoyl-CoA hydratase/carnithine racemase
MVNDLEIPTIGVINGPGFHTEMLLMCDITICSEDAIIYDLHYDIGSVPGDGIHSCFQELLGVKRAAYALLTGQTIDAKDRAGIRHGQRNSSSRKTYGPCLQAG